MQKVKEKIVTENITKKIQIKEKIFYTEMMKKYSLDNQVVVRQVEGERCVEGDGGVWRG